MIVRNHQSEVRRLFPQPQPAPTPKPIRVQRPWSDDEIQTLDHLRAQNLPFSRIAKQLGRTRNSLIGFDWRRRQK